ncbi:hypothetical protein [Acaryochloris marina]|uniref:Uncharacterized protein n=1 Tax=Acaryochloris marina (strain MBIC 11017) TaxID=329726 RepID=B0C3T9_ACAM1|nr:hypothetical protein [Acaryochloris marina]ABW31026.1 hypothetical protein AM1_6094 [Acaryochloris marina MBIC11017]
MKRGLIYYRARQQRFTVVLERDHKSLKPVAPALIKMSLDTNLVLLVMICGRTVGLTHGSCDRLGVNNSKIQTDVGSCCPHMWGLEVRIYE